MSKLQKTHKEKGLTLKFVKTFILAVITFLAINSFSGDVFAKPRVKVRVVTPRIGVITTVKTRPCHKWVKGHYRRNRHGGLVWVPGHWKRI